MSGHNQGKWIRRPPLQLMVSGWEDHEHGVM